MPIKKPVIEIPKGMRSFDPDRMDHYACYRLVGAIIRHTLISSRTAAYTNDVSFYKKRAKSKVVKEIRTRFATNSPLIGLWCALSGYDEGKVRKAIIVSNN